MKWSRESTVKEYDDFKMRRSEITKLKKRYISRYGGLWLSFKQADENIEKRDFQLSEKGKGQSVLELTNNLKKLWSKFRRTKSLY